MIDAGAIDWLTARILETVAATEPIDPASLIFLLRLYIATARDDLREALGVALASALTEPRVEATDPGWLTLFVEASAISDDERFSRAVTDLASGMRSDWERRADIETAAAAIGACVAAAHVIESEIVASAIDGLEQMVGHHYRPGEGIGGGTLGEQVGTASALVTAFAATGRIPYAMLAEELMQFARRTLWNEGGGGFRDTPAAGPIAKAFVRNCEAARVFGRLAELNGDDDYRSASVPTDADYAGDARRTLASQAPLVRDLGLGGASYGLALLDLDGNLK